MSGFGGNPDDIFPDFQRKSESNHKEFNSKILLIAIISLSIVLVLVFALHLYARCFLRRQARRRAAIHHLSLAMAHYSGDPTNNTGLDPTLIASLPTFVFKRKDKSQNNDEDDSSVIECSVCLSNLEDKETARLLPNCKHVFHVACIDTWLASHSTCPICRTLAQPLVIEPQPREGPAGPALPGAYDAPTAPPVVEPVVEGTSDGGGGAKVNGSNSRLSSFRRILSRERSSRRIQPASSSQDDNNGDPDLERQ